MQKIESAGADDLIVYTDLFPDADAERAATGICTSLRNPAIADMEVDLIQVIAANGDEVEPPACEPQ